MVTGWPGRTGALGWKRASAKVLAGATWGTVSPLPAPPQAASRTTVARSAAINRPSRACCNVGHLLVWSASSIGLVDDQRGERRTVRRRDLEGQAPAAHHHQRRGGARVDAGLRLCQLVFLGWHLHLE